MRTDQTQASVRYVAAVVLLLLGRTSQAQVSVVSLPFADGYETGSLGSGWADEGAPSEIQTDEKRQGTYGCKVTGTLAGAGKLSLNVDPAKAYKNVWVQICAKPARLAEEPTLDPGVTTAFYVADDPARTLKARSGDDWVPLMTGFPDTWVQFAVHLDYVNKKWDLYYTDGAYGSVMTKLNVSPFPTPMDFNSGAKTEFNGITVTSEKPSYLDQVIAAKGSAEVSGSSPNRLIVQTASVSKLTMLGLLGNRFPDTDSPPANSLSYYPVASALSKYLMSIMEFGDSITVRIDGKPYTYTYKSGSPPYWDYAGGAPVPATVMITPGMAVWLTKDSPGTIYGFGSYGSGATPPDTTVNGPGTGSGWTLLAWPREFNSTANGAGNWGFDSVAQAGDRIYVRDPSGIWHVLTWNGSAWMEGRNSSTFTMRPGLAFWYFKRPGSQQREWPAHTAQ